MTIKTSSIMVSVLILLICTYVVWSADEDGKQYKGEPELDGVKEIMYYEVVDGEKVLMKTATYTWNEECDECILVEKRAADDAVIARKVLSRPNEEFLLCLSESYPCIMRGPCEFEYTYNAKGQLVKMLESDKKGWSAIAQYEYNKDGALLKRTWTEDNEDLEYVEINQYEYDERGRILREKMITQKAKRRLSCRIINDYKYEVENVCEKQIRRALLYPKQYKTETTVKNKKGDVERIHIREQSDNDEKESTKTFKYKYRNGVLVQRLIRREDSRIIYENTQSAEWRIYKICDTEERYAHDMHGRRTSLTCINRSGIHGEKDECEKTKHESLIEYVYSE